MQSGSRPKILWVVNTVARCQAVARILKRRAASTPVLCYHSRFRLKDRKARHEHVITAFQGAGPLVAVTTQVCEMSLDLDADLLVTEIAPVPAVIQRMGRCCRNPKGGRVGQVWVYRPEASRPYTDEDIAQGDGFSRAMASRTQPLSQAVLTKALDELKVSPLASGGFTSFLDSGMYAMGQDDPFREGDDYTVDAVLDTDVDDYLAMRHQRAPDALGLVLPVPRRFATDDARLGHLLRCAPKEHYHLDFGFCEAGE